MVRYTSKPQVRCVLAFMLRATRFRFGTNPPRQQLLSTQRFYANLRCAAHHHPLVQRLRVHSGRAYIDLLRRIWPTVDFIESPGPRSVNVSPK